MDHMMDDLNWICSIFLIQDLFYKDCNLEIQDVFNSNFPLPDLFNKDHIL
jgi:hypothetical protein